MTYEVIITSILRDILKMILHVMTWGYAHSRTYHLIPEIQSLMLDDLQYNNQIYVIKIEIYFFPFFSIF